MTDNRRDPHSDNDIIDEMDDLATPTQSGASGGAIQREIASRDDAATATGGDPQPTSVHKGDRANQGDEPNLPNREGGGDSVSDRAPPRRTS